MIRDQGSGIRDQRSGHASPDPRSPIPDPSAARRGFVSLVGAGPGDPRLLTVGGLAALKAADVVVYDRLVAESLLDLAPAAAERVFVGKPRGRPTFSQEAINDLLVERARRGQRVVRLKGGDPFVFGRGGEEAATLAAAGIPFEVVPGVTSAIAVPAYAGIPVTQRGVAVSFAVVTGHEDPAKGGTALDWSRLATATDTLVCLMGVERLREIVAELIAHGRAPETPVALIQDGTRPSQRVVTGTLATIAERAAGAGIRPPATAVVGDVVRLRDQIAWFDRQPLFGRTIVVTRARAQASALAAELARRGARVIEAPAIRIAPPVSWVEVDRAIDQAATFNWVVFTSVNGVATVLDRAWERGLDSRILGPARLAAIGPATAQALRERGLRADVVPDEFVAEALAEALGPVRGQQILLARADIARRTLADSLRQQGAEVTEVAAYQTVPETAPSPELIEALRRRQVDLITFTSSSTVKNFLGLIARADGLDPTDLGASGGLAGARIACIGPITAQTAEAVGLRPDVIAETYTIEGLLAAIDEFYHPSSIVRQEMTP